MKKKLIIIGAGGHGKVVADIAQKMNKWKSIAFLDDNDNIKYSMGIKIIGKTSEVSRYITDCDVLVGIGDNSIRRTIQEKLESEVASIPLLIHPSAVIGEKVELGSGTVVMPGVIINSCTKIARGCIINTSATIDHDCLIEDFVHISQGSHLAGTVKVGEESCLGIGSLVSHNVNITSGCKVGAGAVVVNDLTEPGTYFGNPARRV